MMFRLDYIVALIGLVVLLKCIKYIVMFTRLYIVSQYTNLLKEDLSKLGEWAVVTGSTDGIGKEFTYQLAKDGFNIVLVARSESKLIAEKRQLQKEFPIAVRYVVFDFGKTTNYNTLKESIEDLDVGILLNNVGTTLMHPEYFDAMHQQENLQSMINVNVIAAIEMTGIVVHGMKLRGRGLIVTVSSGASNHATPLLSVYTGTKAFLDLFTQSLHAELSPCGIHCQVLAPYFISTKMSNLEPFSFVPSASDYARQAYNTFTLTQRTSGYWSHELQSLMYESLPSLVIDSTAFMFLRQMREDGMRTSTKLNNNGHAKLHH